MTNHKPTELFYKGKPVEIHIDFPPDWIEAFCPICGSSGVAVNKDNVIKSHSYWGEICPGAKLERENGDDI
jgi:hypothetical protein